MVLVPRFQEDVEWVGTRVAAPDAVGGELLVSVSKARDHASDAGMHCYAECFGWIGTGDAEPAFEGIVKHIPVRG